MAKRQDDMQQVKKLQKEWKQERFARVFKYWQKSYKKWEMAAAFSNEKV